jgi:dCTP deaminase
MILTKDKIKEEIAAGNIIIEPPLSEEQIGPGSVDLKLGNVFRRFKHLNDVFPVRDDVNFEDITELVTIEEGKPILIKPGEAILGITVERIKLAGDLAGWIEGRSRFARIGLAVHITSGFAQPGISNHQVLEIANFGPTPLALYPGTKVCQFVFQRCEGKAHYNGRFNAQVNP